MDFINNFYKKCYIFIFFNLISFLQKKIFAKLNLFLKNFKNKKNFVANIAYLKFTSKPLQNVKKY